MIGKAFGHYEIIEKIGQGGMGEVFRARDTRLERDVAIKVLPEDAASNPERIQRFEREAKAIAALKHGNIVTIHSVEEIDGRYCLTMELVDGKTLSELIPQGGMSLEKFFTLAIPLAEALVAAHAKGITHRDLKPSNIMVDADGTLKVLDFGLAKLFAAPGSDDTTIVGDGSVTDEGRVLGTVYYMSPEQAEAKSLDQRSDIFSLGVVLYEMATGKRPFAGDTPISTISAILKETPPSVIEVRDNLPRHLARVIGRCLEKNPDRRFQTARDVANELEGLKKEVESGDIEQSTSGSMSRSSLGLPARRRRGLWPWIVGAAVIIAVVFAGGYFLRGGGGAPEPPREVQTRLMTSMVGTESPGSWSPDGGFFVYSHSAVGPEDIFVGAAAGGDPIKLVESPYDDITPRWSPDNRWVAFVSNRGNRNAIYLIPPLGGAVQKVVETGVPSLSSMRYVSLGTNPWSPDARRLLYTRLDDQGRTVICTMDLDSRAETTIFASEKPGVVCGMAAYSPSGDRIVYGLTDFTNASLQVMPADGGESREIVSGEEQYLLPAWMPDGKRIVYGRASGGILTVNASGGEPSRQLTTGTQESAPVVASDGRILYATFTHQTDLYLQNVATGEAERLTFQTQDNFGAAISPDGRKVAYMSSRTGNAEIWLIDRDTGSERQLTSREADDWEPDWSPDGRQILFGSDQGGTAGSWVLDVETGALRRLGDHIRTGPARWTPDGRAIGMMMRSPEGKNALYLTDPQGGEARRLLDGVEEFAWYGDAGRVLYAWEDGARRELRAANLETGEETVLLDTPFQEIALSPDGSAVSYCSALSHYNMNLHVLPLRETPGGLPAPAGPPRAITHGDGEWHVHNGGWSPDGKFVIYTRDTDTGDIYLMEDAP